MKPDGIPRFLLICLCAALTFSALPWETGAEDVVYSCSMVGKKIALTFDDGPHPTLTPEILGILA
ncbi:MAG: hypothetical protein II953_03485 [Clostridia bacterium]|nr:hypothetical protein [Clostridia bacterium]